jgi:hypothetical protein
MFSIFFLSNSFLFLFSQTINDANLLYGSKKFSEALVIYKTLLKNKPNDIALNFGVGKTFFALEKYEQSIDYLKIASEKNYQNSAKLLALANFYTYRFAAAAEYFEKNPALDTENYYHRAKAGEKMLKKVENVIFTDSIILNKNDLPQYYPQNSEIGFIFSTSAENKICGELFGFLSGKKDRKIFAQNIDNQIDLYQSNFFLDGWSEPKKLSETLNTDLCENYPFVLSDGVTIYFASQGHENLGGYDIFMSRANNSGEFLAPQNIGMPFNSPANDYLMVIDEQKNRGYFASDRNLPDGKVAVYQFVYKEQKNILRENDEDILREKARNIVVLKSQNAVVQEQNFTEGLHKTTEDFYFILTDTVVYQYFSDFKNSEALEKFYQLLNLKNSLNLIEKDLNFCRNSYIFAENEEKFILAEKILYNEKKQQLLENKINTLEKEIRKLEIQVQYP